MYEVTGLLLMGFGSIGVISSTILEWKLGEEKYKIMMKVFPWLLALGAFVYNFGGFH